MSELTEADLARKPAAISFEEAGSLPLVALTAWQALIERGNVQPGQKGPDQRRGRRCGLDRHPVHAQISGGDMTVLRGACCVLEPPGMLRPT